MRLAACVACLMAAVDAFAVDPTNTPTGFPYLVYILFGFNWLFITAWIALRGTDK